MGNFAKFCKFLAGSFSAVSKRNFARKYAFDSIFQALQDLHTFATLQSQHFFRAHRTNDLTKKLEKVGPFECDELEKHCRVSAKCYPTKVPALYTMTKEKFKSVFLVLLLLVSRQTKSQLLMLNNLVPIK